jgi:hypothetical protein
VAVHSERPAADAARQSGDLLRCENDDFRQYGFRRRFDLDTGLANAVRASCCMDSGSCRDMEIVFGTWTIGVFRVKRPISVSDWDWSAEGGSAERDPPKYPYRSDSLEVISIEEPRLCHMTLCSCCASGFYEPCAVACHRATDPCGWIVTWSSVALFPPG